MKLLFTEGVGAAQTTTNAQDEKIKIFASESDMLDNINTLNENEIVATNDATEADLIGNMLTEIAALKEKLDERTPRLIDFNIYSESSFVGTSGQDFTFTASQDCFFATSQQWGTSTDVTCSCSIYDLDGNVLVHSTYSGYSLPNSQTVFSGYVFIPKGKSVKYRFTQGSGSLQNPKIIVRTK